MSTEELYDKLVVAYMHLKDVTILQQGLVPVKEDNALEAQLHAAEDTIAEQAIAIKNLETELASKLSELVQIAMILKDWHDTNGR